MHRNTITVLPVTGPTNIMPSAGQLGTAKRPPATCPAHSRYCADCDACKETQAAYKRWRRKQIAYGLFSPHVDADAARKHLNAEMTRHKLTPRQVAPLCNLSTSLIRNVATGRVRKIRRENEAAILAIDFETIIAEATIGTVSSIGASRRLRALMAIGYSARHLAPLLGVTHATVASWRRRTPVDHHHHACRRIAVKDHRRVAAVYAELHTRPGPSTEVAIKARGLGYAPPICWDDDEHLDNPQARPRGYPDWLRLNPDHRTLAGAA